MQYFITRLFVSQASQSSPVRRAKSDIWLAVPSTPKRLRNGGFHDNTGTGKTDGRRLQSCADQPGDPFGYRDTDGSVTHPKRREQTLLHVRKRRKSGSMGKIHIFGI